jgi:hypothetical protein
MRALFISVASLGASWAPAAQFSNVDGKFVCPSISKAQACAESIEASLHSAVLRRLTADRLDVTLSDGRIRSFVDVPPRGASEDGASTVYYHAIEITGDSRYVLIHMQRYEWSEYGLLDRNSGRFTTFNGYPVFSPDYRWLAVVEGHESQDVVFQILEVRDGTYRLALDASERAWWPTQLRWTSATSLSYRRTSLRGNSGAEVIAEPGDITIRFNGDTWR